MVQAIDVLVVLHTPLYRYVCHADFLALVDERCAGLESEEDGNELGTCLPVFGPIVGKTTHGAGLIMILQVKSIPTVVVVHEALPLVDFGFQFR